MFEGTTYFLYMQEKSPQSAIFLVEGVKCRGTECKFSGRADGATV